MMITKRPGAFIPGELQAAQGEIEINQGKTTISVSVQNKGDRPIQIGSHYHFFEVNEFLVFEREVTKGFRLNIPAGTATRFEPGQLRSIELVEYAGKREVYGFQAKVMGTLD